MTAAPTPALTPHGDRLFRFVVIADTHINQTDDKASSFFALNRLANGRAADAFHAAQRYAPAFVLHLGDIVHPIPSHPEFGQAAANYRALAAGFDCPVYLTPGNHDIGDKPWPLAPVAQIAPDFMAAYDREFGKQWLTWSYDGCDFFIINTSLINSGLPEEVEQQAWFEDALRRSTGRKFLAVHYPPFVHSADEPSHYDNLDEPGRGWLLGLMRTHAIEAVFCGHVHNLWYDQYGETEMYLLPSTAFVRQDYAEMQRVCPPGEEGGRQDIDKLGFFVVDVYASGHIAHYVRLQGDERRGERRQVALADTLSGMPPHPKRPLLPNLGIDPAYPWADEILVPPSGALDAFDSKFVRNDYPLFAMLGLGLSRMRIPLSDLDHPARVTRLAKLARIGMRAQLVTARPLDARQIERVATLGPAVAAIEFVATEAGIAAAAPALAAMQQQLPGCALVLSKLRGPQDAAVDGLNYGHLVFHGWVPAEQPRIAALMTQHDWKASTEVLFRARFTESPLAMAAGIDAFSRECGVRAGLLVRLATDNPAQPQDDALALCSLVLETAIAAHRYPELRFTIEGLVDFDRGYFLRLALVDRSFNPRLPALALPHLCARLTATGTQITGHTTTIAADGTRTIRLDTALGALHIVIACGAALAAARARATDALAQGARCWTLSDGEPVAATHATRTPTDRETEAILIDARRP
ncbi:metallophosphoesterase [Imbroritus primus]|uniref:metallophosphoesterase family protein n=1 Tax=Imbroritus primus TaxID=3058603 RepID=UPI003D161A15